jgi:hypothetical protein
MQFVTIFFLVLIVSLQSCSEENEDFDATLPMDIPCADCGVLVSQRDLNCDECDFLVSNSIESYRQAKRLENDKIKEEERLRRERSYWNKLDAFPVDFNIRLIPGSPAQVTFLNIFDNYLNQTYGKSSDLFSSAELKEKQSEFVNIIKDPIRSISVKVKNSKILCSCAKGKVIAEESSLKRNIIECNLCRGKGYTLGTVDYKMFYSEYKPGGVQTKQ